jgi:hypothetical protein
MVCRHEWIQDLPRVAIPNNSRDSARISQALALWPIDGLEPYVVWAPMLCGGTLVSGHFTRDAIAAFVSTCVFSFAWLLNF